MSISISISIIGGISSSISIINILSLLVLIVLSVVLLYDYYSSHHLRFKGLREVSIFWKSSSQVREKLLFMLAFC